MVNKLVLNCLGMPQRSILEPLLDISLYTKKESDVDKVQLRAL